MPTKAQEVLAILVKDQRRMVDLENCRAVRMNKEEVRFNIEPPFCTLEKQRSGFATVVVFKEDASKLRVFASTKRSWDHWFELMP